MQTTYRDHFKSYGCRLYTLTDYFPDGLRKDEIEQLSGYGLPDSGLPFFHFDLTLQYLRDIDFEDNLLVLGSGARPASYDYIYLSRDHAIRLRCPGNGPNEFINSTLEQLIQCIYQYSQWLEEMERIFLLEGQQSVEHRHIFDLYYTIRSIDPEAVREQTIWHMLIHTEINLKKDYFLDWC